MAKTIWQSGEAIRGRVGISGGCRSLGFSAIPANVPALGNRFAAILIAESDASPENWTGKTLAVKQQGERLRG
jgi:hypothetical protein